MQTSNIKHQTSVVVLFLFFISFFNFGIINAQTTWCGNELLSPPPPFQIDPNYYPICGNDEVKYIRVNYHFVAEDSGSGNFGPDNDGGLNYTNKNGYNYAEDIINRANEHLANNPISWLWHIDRGNDPAVVKYRLVLSGVYFHKNTLAYWTEDFYNYSFETSNLVDVNTVHNIFDSNLKGTDGKGPSGVGPFRQRFCVVDNYDPYKKIVSNAFPLQYDNTGTNNTNYDVLDQAARTILHELGHNFNILHTWRSDDGCSDTPMHDNCSYGVNSANNPNIVNDPDYQPSCDDAVAGSKISNNLMDYNLYYPGALTPCQADKINDHLNYFDTRGPQTMGCNICPDAENSSETPAIAYFTTNKSVYDQSDFIVWGGNINYEVVLNGFGTFNETEYKLEICKTGSYLSNNQNCISHNYTSGIINGSIQISNLFYSYNFSQNSTYKISLTTNNANCPLDNTFTKYIKIKSSYLPPQLGCKIADFQQNGDKISIGIAMSESTNAKIIATQLTGLKKIYTITESEFYHEGDHKFQFNTSGFEKGLYYLIVIPQVGGTACYRSFTIFGN